MSTWSTRLLLASALALCALPTWAAGPPPRTSYDFVLVAVEPDFIVQLGGAINNKGEVAFRARLPTGDNVIYLWERGRLTPVAAVGPFEFLSGPDLNDRGEVSFMMSQPSPGTASFLKVRDGRVVERIDESGNPFDLLICCPLINNRGDITVHGVADGIEGIFVVRGGRVTTLADSTGPYSYFSPPDDINDRGEVVFGGNPDDLDGSALVVGDGRRTRVVVDGSGPFEFFRTAAINPRGDVAVQAFPDGGSPEPSILVADRTGIRVAVAFGGPFVTPDFPLLDPAGRLVFTDTTLGTIFAGPGAEAVRILGPGDPLAGSTVETAAAVDINAAGVLLVFARLEDGRQGLWLARPRGGS